MKKIKNLIKNNWVFLISLIIIYLVFSIKLPYYIDAPGGLININDRYKVEEEYEIKGSINMTYVSEYHANIASFIIAKINKNMDIYKKNDIIPDNETEKDNDIRGEIMLKEASDNAIIVAYNKANKECLIKNQKIIVTYIDSDANTNLKIGDEIISIDNFKVSSVSDAKEIIKNYDVNKKISFKVINNNKEYDKYAYVNDKYIIGILLSYERELETNPKIIVKYEKGEYGPSGGLMTSLAIYNKLVKEDITHGYTISGTGTIEEDGTVGEIDGIKYKLKGAVKNKADVFFAPSGDNYKEAKKLKNKYNYEIDIVEVKTIDDALNYLEKLKEE
jgi:PDZ domain-containing protein